MKILYHHRTLGDGAEGIHIAEMVAAFRELGHEVQVLGLATGGDATTRQTRIARIRDLTPRALFELASVGSNVVEYLAVRRAIRLFAPDFLYKRHARNDVGALAAARRAGVPSLLEVNCLFTGEGYRAFEPMALEPLAAALEKRALRMATERLAVSTPLAQQIATMSQRAAVVVPNGTDPRRFDPARVTGDAVRARYGLTGALVIGWTGVLRDWHGLDILLESMTHARNGRLLIVGGGPAQPAVEARAAALGVADRLIVTGRVPYADIPAHVAAMDIAVVAHDHTGVASPMKLLEYMAMGRPVVAPRLGNILDVVADGETGVLFPPGDAAALGATLQRLAADTVLRQRLGAAARASIESSRNWRAIAAQVVERMRRASIATVGREREDE
jgi:glycosyltransferase involved in cell wall biosynthesis